MTDILVAWNCRKCGYEFLDGKYGRNKSMQELARITVGTTKTGVQIWCVRHDILIANIDLQDDHKIMNMPFKCEFCTTPNCEHEQ